MRTILLFVAFLFVNAFAVNAQKDPAAEKVLNALKANYESYTSMKVAFDLTIKFPETEPEIQKGNLAQKGDQFHAVLGGQEVYSDGKSLWTYLESRNEVQITDVDTDMGGMQSPKDLLTIYEKEEYAYVLVGEVKDKDGATLQQIEFKPLTDESEFFKIRLSVVKGKNQPRALEAFSADGSRYTLRVKSLETNVSFPDSEFVFNKADYPGVYVEDLRL